jgi:hypothetical protein
MYCNVDTAKGPARRMQSRQLSETQLITSLIIEAINYTVVYPYIQRKEIHLVVDLGLP